MKDQIKHLCTLKKWLCPILFFMLTPVGAHNIEEDLRSLDWDVEHHSEFIKQKEERINRLKQDLSVSSFPSDQYMTCRKLYEEYLKFDTDSAFSYASLCHELGVKQGREEWRKEAELDVIRTYVFSSYFVAADEALRNYGPIEDVPSQLREAFAQTVMDYQIRICALMVETSMSKNYQKKRKEAWSEYAKYITPSSARYLFFDFFVNKYDHRDFDLEQKLREALSETHDFTSGKAMLELTLAAQMQQKGDTTAFMHHLIQSARCDIRTANRESEALSMLMSILSKQNEGSRALNYALFCSENTQKYKDRGRSLTVLNAQSIIQRNYKASIESYIDVIYMILATITILCLIIIIMFVLLKQKNRKQHIIHKEIEWINEKLQKQIERAEEMTHKYKETNAELTDEIKKRESHFIDIFYLCSGYIHELTSFRKKMHSMLKNGMINEAKRTASTSILSDEELAKLHQQFDRIFISTHPDFVKRFNELLRPEEQIKIKDDYTLTPELRIYALICLGIEDGVRIADFLHYSPQTIYNYRHKVRRASAIADNDFTDAVKNLYGLPSKRIAL